MPELPEVETVRRGLAPAMEGAVIDLAQVNRPDLRWPFPEQFADRLTGRRVLRLGRRSKYLLAELDGDETLIVHLGMSGRMTVSGDPLGQFHHDHPMPEKHDHVVLNMGNGARITFNDPRRFGAMDLWPSAEVERHWLIRNLGPEPLGNAFSEGYFVERLKTRNTPMKAALLDQRVVAGLGNIYVCEVLHRAGIDPRRTARRVSDRRLAATVPIVRDVLSEAIEAGGSSLRDYRRADGELGYFQHVFRVYDREGHPCPREGCGGTVTRIVQSGRSTFWCPACQR
ncbi:bifunctional DNA-formamidopyrimidine glycosylase/DNA-(apurinic or apyrimidinic site) lyase [Pelagovum pacificum]|uniref:Formamidopyrimidine-DNA glycosylase n=1 Tax=Pelagovum pacificum TaxID=2588711 RepID=A0A5C5GIZ3_9RHOB|nr:bifunctional DNA-formamidopyrimidine glycosylase/DNA-(apurinic or apyrimidinic site) lyase [Pelagovum pacificum]QQA42996.1 bifunctional DNA-formamidopyrimidine glycosylase/DNA-(apurinic or apyrimidinic site) lyase [Pelagovum pacificum]TNY33859.1 bifunctional DNA-formamidopyrimidine glycosylase/DNA-(apurinic or apyrimidinic site) lyase [Pelagovum pacificum]